MSITSFFEDEPEGEPEPEEGYGVARLVAALFIALVIGCLFAVAAAMWGPPWE